MWLIIALTVTFSIAAAVWVGRIASENVLQQHVRRLSLETDQLSSDLGQALAARLDAVRVAGPLLRAAHAPGPSSLGQVFEQLVAAYPQLDWIAIADTGGGVVASNGAYRAGDNVATSPWFASGSRGPWLGVIGAPALQPLPAANVASLGDTAIPVREESGRVVGVIAAHLSWRRSAQHPERLTDEPRAATVAYVLDRDGIVLVGPADLRNRRWNGIAVNHPLLGAAPGSPPGMLDAPQFERLPDGRRVLVSRSLVSAGNEANGAGMASAALRAE